MYELFVVVVVFTPFITEKLIWINAVGLEAEFIRGSVRELAYDGRVDAKL